MKNQDLNNTLQRIINLQHLVRVSACNDKITSHNSNERNLSNMYNYKVTLSCGTVT